MLNLDIRRKKICAPYRLPIFGWKKRKNCCNGPKKNY